MSQEVEETASLFRPSWAAIFFRFPENELELGAGDNSGLNESLHGSWIKKRASREKKKKKSPNPITIPHPSTRASSKC
jgi:hypothetical protein